MAKQARIAIDHAIIYGKDHGFLAEVFGKLGFASPDGKYYMFRKNYLEYLVPGEGISATEGKSYSFFPGPSGLHTLVLWSDDADESYAALKQAGYALPAPVMEFSRPAFLEGEEKTARFRGTLIATPLFPLSEIMMVHHLTPELVYLPGQGEHPNGVDSVEEFYLCVPDEGQAEQVWENLEKTGRLLQGDHPQHECINLVSVSTDWEPEFGVKTDPARSCVCGIRFSCRDLDKVKAAVAASGYPFHAKDGGVVVDLARELDLFLYFQA